MNIQPTINNFRAGITLGIRKFKKVARQTKDLALRQRRDGRQPGGIGWKGGRVDANGNPLREHEHMGQHVDMLV